MLMPQIQSQVESVPYADNSGWKNNGLTPYKQEEAGMPFQVRQIGAPSIFLHD